MSKRDDQVLEVLSEHDLSTFAILYMVLGRPKPAEVNERIKEMTDHLEDMASRGLVEEKQDTVAAWRTLWRKL